MLSAGRIAAASLVTLITLAAAPALAQTDTYPNRTIRIINPFSPGGPSDIYLRPMFDRISEWVKQPIVIESNPGASGDLGAQIASRAAPDGYTFLIISNTHAINEALGRKRAYSLMNDFIPVTQFFRADHVLVAHPSLPVKSVKELIAAAKDKPGGISFASSGPGSNYHLAGELFGSLAGVKLFHVPYRSSGQARTDVLAGHVQLIFDTTATMKPSIEAGKVTVLGTTGPTRSRALPDVPTVAEAGVPGYEVMSWAALMAPAGTPKPLIEKLQDYMRRYTETPEAKAIVEKQGWIAVANTPDEFSKVLRDEISFWQRVIKDCDCLTAN